VKKFKPDDLLIPGSSSDHQKGFVLCELSRLNIFLFRKAAVDIDQEQPDDEDSSDEEERADEEVILQKFSSMPVFCFQAEYKRDTKSYVYLIVDLRVWNAATSDKKRRKAVIYWGYTINTHDRWFNHKSDKKLNDVDYRMVIVREWTSENLPTGVVSHHQAALIDEHVIGSFSGQFTPHTAAKSGNGNLEDPLNKKLAQEGNRGAEMDILLTDIINACEPVKFEVSFYKNQLITKLFRNSFARIRVVRSVVLVTAT
jgi:hypothetical protein